MSDFRRPPRGIAGGTTTDAVGTRLAPWRFMVRTCLATACLLIAGTSSSEAMARDAAGWTDIAALERSVTGALDRSVGAPGGLARALDPRLRLPACPIAPTIGVTPDRVRIACASAGWSFAVPRIASGDEARPIDPARTPPPAIVRRGAALVVLVEGPGFTARLDGTAASDGAVGEVIAVDRPGGAPIRARILDAATASADDPD